MDSRALVSWAHLVVAFVLLVGLGFVHGGHRFYLAAVSSASGTRRRRHLEAGATYVFLAVFFALTGGALRETYKQAGCDNKGWPPCFYDNAVGYRLLWAVHFGSLALALWMAYVDLYFLAAWSRDTEGGDEGASPAKEADAALRVRALEWSLLGWAGSDRLLHAPAPRSLDAALAAVRVVPVIVLFVLLRYADPLDARAVGGAIGAFSSAVWLLEGAALARRYYYDTAAPTGGAAAV